MSHPTTGCCGIDKHVTHNGSPSIEVQGRCCCGTVTFTKFKGEPAVETPKVVASILDDGTQVVKVRCNGREYSIADAITQTRIDMNLGRDDTITVTFKGTVASKGGEHRTPHFNPGTRHSGQFCVCRCGDCTFGGTCKCEECSCGK